MGKLIDSKKIVLMENSMEYQPKIWGNICHGYKVSANSRIRQLKT
jgi:hypothetical protein